MKKLIEARILTARSELFEICETILAECNNDKWSAALSELKAICETKADSGEALPHFLSHLNCRRFEEVTAFGDEHHPVLKEKIEACENLARPEYQMANVDTFVILQTRFILWLKHFVNA